MTELSRSDIEALVERERVHCRVYIDPALFTLEMERIFGRVWVFVGHDSQVPEPGDWVRTQIGPHDVVMTRHHDGGVRVLQNRCAHRSMAVCVHPRGHGARLVCPYHGWSYDTDGALLGRPHPSGYDRDAKVGMPAVPRVDSHRGFVFASLAETGPSLLEYLGDMADALDNMADRAPDGEVEMVGGRLRQTFRGNWKLHMENAVDTVHPNFVHESSVAVARDHLAVAGPAEQADQAIQMFNANGFSFSDWDGLGIHGYDDGHVFMDGFYRGGVIDPDRAITVQTYPRRTTTASSSSSTS